MVDPEDVTAGGFLVRMSGVLQRARWSRSLMAGVSGAALGWPVDRARRRGKWRQTTDGWMARCRSGRARYRFRSRWRRSTRACQTRCRRLRAARHGYIVFERYYGGQDPESPINVRSVTKSTGTLAGAALRAGLLDGPEQPWARPFPSGSRREPIRESPTSPSAMADDDQRAGVGRP